MMEDTEQPQVRLGRRSVLRRALILGLGVPLVAAALAACGNPGTSGNNTSGNAPASPTSQGSGGGTASGGVTVKVGNTKDGKVLVDSKGMTLYIYTADKKGKSNCTTQYSCLTLWPPLYTTGTPKAGPGVSQSKLGTITRTDNHKQQVTYNGMPLYYYIQDKKPGDVTGQKVKDPKGIWYVAKP